MCKTVNGPGKFEGEPCYAEELYQKWNDGELEDHWWDEEGELVSFLFLKEDPEFVTKHSLEINPIVAISIYEDGYGFVHTHELTQLQYDRTIEQYVSSLLNTLRIIHRS